MTTALASAARPAGRPVAVSGAAVPGTRTLLEAAGMEEDVLVGGDLVDRPKPAPDGPRLIAQQLGGRFPWETYVGMLPRSASHGRWVPWPWSQGGTSVQPRYASRLDPESPPKTKSTFSPTDHGLTAESRNIRFS